MRRLGVDTGGTFTDFVYLDGSEITVHKVLSTPASPDQAILQGIHEMGLSLSGLDIVHGSTVATNAVLEHKGVRTAYITNRGFADLLTIGRQARRELYHLQPAPVVPPVPPELCLETGGRLAADGNILDPLTNDDLEALQAAIKKLKPDAVAINLLFSFLDGQFERQIEEIIPHGIFVSRSSAVLNEYREYERGMATWLNAYVGPLMKNYLGNLATVVQPAKVSVMQSHGGTVPVEQAGDLAVQLLLSGPAGGLVGAQFQGKASERSRILSFDMGGTSTDVALIDDDIQLSSESEIAGYPVAAPMVDMHTIGAGGGSIAWLDEGGMLQVGPQSAGADPGPACYGNGGTLATVTDANLLLGHLPLSTSLGGNLSLDYPSARKAVSALAKSASLSIEEMAKGVISLANEHMAQALRVISVQRGFDPQDFTLLSFGGSGGLHVCALAEQLGMRRAFVPAHGGVLSALGMVVAQPARELSRSQIKKLDETDFSFLDDEFTGMENQLVNEMQATHIKISRRVDLRYQGQSSTLPIIWHNNPALLESEFHLAHQQRFGHALEIPVEMVNLRVRATIEMEPAILAENDNLESSRPISHSEVVGESESVQVYQRSDLAVGQKFMGPTILIEPVATTYVERGWIAEMDVNGNLLLRKQCDAADCQ